jgi:hypothetical protein
MLLTLMAPEILIGLALSQFVAARHGRDTMQDFVREDGVEWTLEHSHFADMGGFVISFPDSSGVQDSGEDTKLDNAKIWDNELTVAAGAVSQGNAEGDIPTRKTISSLDEAPSLRRAVNLLPRGVISAIKTTKDPRTESLSVPLSRGMMDD